MRVTGDVQGPQGEFLDADSEHTAALSWLCSYFPAALHRVQVPVRTTLSPAELRSQPDVT